jgi:PhnB protein
MTCVAQHIVCSKYERILQMKPTISISTYILFDGTCQEAMKYYQSCLGGELTLTKVSDSSMKNQMPPTLHNKVLNARLRGENMDVSASDWMRLDQNPKPGNTVCLFVRCETHEELEQVFCKLSQGAEITDPLKKMWFGSYGALNDPFGVRWMFHADAN